jgi:hypothetical protein
MNKLAKLALFAVGGYLLYSVFKDSGLKSKPVLVSSSGAGIRVLREVLNGLGVQVELNDKPLSSVELTAVEKFLTDNLGVMHPVTQAFVVDGVIVPLDLKGAFAGIGRIGAVYDSDYLDGGLFNNATVPDLKKYFSSFFGKPDKIDGDWVWNFGRGIELGVGYRTRRYFNKNRKEAVIYLSVDGRTLITTNSYASTYKSPRMVITMLADFLQFEDDTVYRLLRDTTRREYSSGEALRDIVEQIQAEGLESEMGIDI